MSGRNRVYGPAGNRAARRVLGGLSMPLLAGVLALFPPGTAFAQQSCDQLPRGVAGWWPGDGNPDDLTLAVNNGQLMNGATFAPGLIGDAFSLDGVNDRVDIPDAPALRPQRFTLAAWIRLDKINAQNCFICKQFGSSTVDSFSLWANGTELRGGMFGLAEATAAGVVRTGRFQHIATTYDGSLIRLYLNGALIASAPGPVGAIPYDSNQVVIGADDNGINAFSGFVDGIIDEPMIFGRGLTPCEIRALYRAQPQGNCKGDTDGDLIPDFEDNCIDVQNAAQVDGDSDGVGDLCDCAPSDPGAYAEPGDRWLLRFEPLETADWCPDPSVTGPDTVYDVIRGSLDDLPVATGTTTCRSRCIAPLSGLVGWWSGDGSGTDLIGGNTATLFNGATTINGWVLDSFSLDGVNDYVRTGNLTLGNTFSVAAWVNSALGNQGAYKRIVETSFASGLFIGTDGTGAAYKLIVKNPTAPYGTANGGKIVPGVWQLVVGTYDGTTGRLYVDGKQVASAPFAAPGTVTLPAYFGIYPGGGSLWKGLIDEVQIYDRALSAGEVTAIWEAGSAGQCKIALGGTDAEWTAPWAPDAELPSPGHGFWYLYRGRNVCGTGSYGFASDTMERISLICD